MIPCDILFRIHLKSIRLIALLGSYRVIVNGLGGVL